MKGLFITVEGGEGAGKTTLINSLSKKLEQEGAYVQVTREPGGTDLGEQIRQLLLSPPGQHQIDNKAELLLFLAARAQHYHETILPAVAEGKIVLCDRFHDSTIAYQGMARGLGVETVKELCLFTTDGKYPDLTFYLDIDPHIGLNRGRRVGSQDFAKRKKDRIEAEALEFHQSVREAFLELMKESPKRCKIINAAQPQQKVLKQTLELVYDKLKVHK